MASTPVRPLRTFDTRPQPARVRRIAAAFVALALAMLAVVGRPTTVDAQGLLNRIDRPVQQLLGTLTAGTTRVIVRMEPGALDRLLRLVPALGGAVHAQHRFIDSVTLTLPALQLPLLLRLPGVVSVSLDAAVQGPFPGEGDGSSAASHLASTLGLDAPDLLGRGIDGRGVGVAVIDSGLTRNGAYDVRHFVDFTRPSRGRSYTEHADPADAYGHGTHVAGLIAGNGTLSSGRYRGVAPAASLVGLKVLDAQGAGLTSDVLVAIEYAIERRRDFNLRVVNLSLGHPIFEPADRDPLVRGVEAAVRAGLVVVVSAGNVGCLPGTSQCGYAGITSPGNAPSAITVGALDTRQTTSRLDDVVATYSSRGPSWYDGFVKPDLVAPGHRLVSTIPPSSTLGRQPDRIAQRATPWLAYARLSGTSMAAAVTAGAAALVIDASERTHRGRLTPNAVKAILEYTAFDVTGADALTQGAGALNAAGAIELAWLVDPSVPVGGAWLDQPVVPVTTIGGEALPWSQRLLWGDRPVSGDLLGTHAEAWGQTIVWGDTLVWGDTIVWGDTLVWGDTIVWGETLVWADTIVWGNAMVDVDTRTWANLAPVP